MSGLPNFTKHKTFLKVKKKMGITTNKKGFTPTLHEQLGLTEHDHILYDLDDISSDNDGSLLVGNRKVLMYLLDRYWSPNIVGRKRNQPPFYGLTFSYHIAECKEVKKKREEGEDHRYIAREVTDGQRLPTKVKGRYDIRLMDRTPEYQVCRYCLRTLNYNFYKTIGYGRWFTKRWRNRIWSDFDPEEYLKDHINLVSELPDEIVTTQPQDSQKPEDPPKEEIAEPEAKAEETPGPEEEPSDQTGNGEVLPNQPTPKQEDTANKKTKSEEPDEPQLDRLRAIVTPPPVQKETTSDPPEEEPPEPEEEPSDENSRIKMKDENILGLVCGYYLSKFDTAYKEFGFPYKTETQIHEEIARKLGVKASSIKNWRDEFDHLHPESGRKGWKKDLIPSRKNVVAAMGQVTMRSLKRAIDRFLDHPHGDVAEQIIKAVKERTSYSVQNVSLRPSVESIKFTGPSNPTVRTQATPTVRTQATKKKVTTTQLHTTLLEDLGKLRDSTTDRHTPEELKSRPLVEKLEYPLPSPASFYMRNILREGKGRGYIRIEPPNTEESEGTILLVGYYQPYKVYIFWNYYKHTHFESNTKSLYVEFGTLAKSLSKVTVTKQPLPGSEEEETIVGAPAGQIREGILEYRKQFQLSLAQSQEG